MPDVGGDVNVTSRLKPARLGVAFEKQAGGPGEDKDPFGLVLVIPLVSGRRLSGRHDPLDSDIRRLEQRGDLLVRKLGRDIRQRLRSGSGQQQHLSDFRPV
jgi:hypothetical protein